MLYDYMCNKCEVKYERSNSIEHRNKGGRCPKCTSSDTRQIISTPSFKGFGSGSGGKGWDGKGVMQ